MFSEPTNQQKLIKAKEFSFEELMELFKTKSYDTTLCYCKKCGKPIIYDTNRKFKEVISHGNLTYVIACPSFLTTKNYNGHEYRLQYCRDCVEKKFPEKKGKTIRNYFQPAAFVTQYAYQVPDEDFNLMKNKVCSHTYESTITKWGKELGEKKWQSYCDKQALTNTYEYKKKKYGWTRQQFREYNLSRAVTVENLVNRYGEEIGKKKWNEYCEKQRYTCSLEYFIKTYGEEKGLEKYKAFDNNRFFNPYKGKCGAYSPISQELFKHISENFKDNTIYFATNTNNEILEYPIGPYQLDYYDETLNAIIEFNGDLWHANPKKYSQEDYVKNPFLGSYRTAAEIWENDKIRIDYICNKLNNPTVIIVWESDYKSDPQGVEESIVKQLKEIQSTL